MARRGDSRMPFDWFVDSIGIIADPPIEDESVPRCRLVTGIPKVQFSFRGLLRDVRLIERDQFHIADTRRCTSRRSGSSVEGQALAGGGGVDEAGKNSFSVFGKDFDGVTVHDNFDGD